MREQAEFQLRPAVRGDELTIHALHRASATRLCTSHYDLDLIEHWIAARTPEGYLDAIDRGEMFVCEVNGRMAGFGHAVPGEIEAIFVHPDWARRGVGSRLLAQALQRAGTGESRIRLVATLNAQAFYERHGFQARRRFSVKRGTVEVPVVEMELRQEA